MPTDGHRDLRQSLTAPAFVDEQIAVGDDADAALRRPRVLLVAPWFGPAYNGGAPRLFDMLLSNMRAIDVVVLADSLAASAHDNAAFDRAALAERGYRVHRQPLQSVVFPSHLPRIGKLLHALRTLRDTRRSLRACIAAERPDIVVAGNSYFCGWLWRHLPNRLRRVNYVHGEEMTMALEYGPLSRWLKRHQLAALREADRNIAVSRYSAEAVVALAGARADRVTVLPNAVDTLKFAPSADRDADRARFGWAGRTVLLSIARLVPRKGIDQVLRALRVADGLPADWLYVIAGRGPMEQQLKALVVELDLQARVRFSGFVDEDDLAAMYGAADVFIQPNRCIDGDTEGFGIVFLEASACGTPVIGGIAGGTGDAIEDDVSGLRVDGDSVDAVRAAIVRLMADPALRQRMADDGLARVRREFTAPILARQFERLMAEVWSTPRSR